MGKYIKRGKMGRPMKEIDAEQFRKLCQIQCTLVEISGWFACSEDTIERWCKRELGITFAEAYKNYSADGKISLRRLQFKHAEKNTSMAIWLGKQYLGQREVQEINVTPISEETRAQVEALLNDQTASNNDNQE
jgi:hypothetical protein